MRRATSDEVGDFVIESGPNAGKRVDFLFTADSPQAVQHMSDQLLGDLSATQNLIVKHLQKADIVPMDFRNLNPTAQAAINGILNSLSPFLRAKALILK